MRQLFSELTFPRIDQRQTGGEVFDIASHHCQSMHLRRCSKQCIQKRWFAFSQPHLASVNRPPETHQSSVNWQNSSSCFHLIREADEPFHQNIFSVGWGHIDNAPFHFPKSQNRNGTLGIMLRQPPHHSRIFNAFGGLTDHHGVEEKFHEKSTSRGVPGVLKMRLWSVLSGQAKRWSNILHSFSSSIGDSRRKSSSDSTTTTGFPCRVMVCAPSVSARFTNSLKEFFASCNCHSGFLFFKAFT